METEQNDFVLSDDAIAEQGKVGDVGETLRSELAESLGLADDEDHKDVLDKAVERELGLRKGYGELLGKKYIPMKKAYQELVNDPRLKSEKPEGFDPDKFSEKVKGETLGILNEQFLDDSDYTDEFKGKIREELGRNPGKTISFVLKNSDYLKFYKEKEDEAQRVAEAANNGNGQNGTTKMDGGNMPDKFSDPKFMATEEGRKEFDEWTKANKKS